jgi:hypothetical protein
LSPQAGAPGAAPRIDMQAPRGFENFTRDRELLLDVYFDDHRLGQILAKVDGNRIVVKDPGKLAEMIPGLRDKAPVLAALKAPVAAQTRRACPQGEDVECRTPDPDTIGFALDEARLRLNLFVNPRHLDSRALGFRKHLGSGENGVGFLALVDATVGGRIGEKPEFGVSTLSLLSYREGRLRADVGFNRKLAPQPNVLAAEWDFPGWRATAGYFRGLGSQLVPEVRFYGIGAGTSTDTRLDLDQAFGSQLAVYLPRPAFVEILRDGRVLSTRLYQPGNRALDTSALPGGAYNVTLRIRELGGGEREERRFFTKSEILPPLDQPVFFVHAGTLAHRADSGLPRPSPYPIAKGTLRWRVAGNMALGFEAAGTRREGAFEGSVHWVDERIRLTASALFTTSLDYGVGLSLGGNVDRFGYSASLRYVRAARGSAANADDPRTFRFVSGHTVQAAGALSYQFERARIGVTGQYRSGSLGGAPAPASYAFGPNADVRLWRNDTHTVGLSAEFLKTDRGYAAQARLTWRWLAPKGVTVTAESGLRAERLRPDPQRLLGFGRADVTYQPPPVWNHEILLRPSVQYDRGIIGGLDVQTRGPTGRFSGSIRASYDQTEGETSRQRLNGTYAASYSFGVAADRNGVAFGGRDANQAAVIARIDGPKSAGQYRVHVNGGPVATLSAGERVPIFLLPYKRYEISILPAGADQPLTALSGASGPVVLYPGSVKTLRWSAEPVTVVFGRVTDPAGRPIPHAAIEGAISQGESDAAGYFQVEVRAQAPGRLVFVDRNGARCAATLPRLDPRAGLARAGNVICAGTPP